MHIDIIQNLHVAVPDALTGKLSVPTFPRISVAVGSICSRFKEVL